MQSMMVPITTKTIRMKMMILELRRMRSHDVFICLWLISLQPTRTVISWQYLLIEVGLNG